MKRIISAFVLICICIGVCVTSSIVAENKTEKLIEKLDMLEEELLKENYESAVNHIRELEKEWETGEKIFSSLSETKLIDELNLSFNSLEKYIVSEETGHAIIVIEECRNGLETICQWQKITIDNIL